MGSAACAGHRMAAIAAGDVSLVLSDVYGVQREKLPAEYRRSILRMADLQIGAESRRIVAESRRGTRAQSDPAACAGPVDSALAAIRWGDSEPGE